MATAPAWVHPLRGDELIRNQQVYGTTTHRVRLRYNESVGQIKTSWRIVFNGRVLDIVSAIVSDEWNRWQELMCRESE